MTVKDATTAIGLGVVVGWVFAVILLYLWLSLGKLPAELDCALCRFVR